MSDSINPFNALHVNPCQMKPLVLVPYKEKSTLVGRHIHWLKQERHGLNKIAAKALIALECIGLSLTGIGLYTVYQGLKESKRINSQQAFYKDIQDNHWMPPLPDEKIVLKSKTRTYNHTHDFAIENNIIWTRLRHTQNTWKPVYFDGFSTGQVPKELHADGTNLIVLDQNNQVHYKKVLAELRNEEIISDPKAANKVKEVQGLDLKKDSYIAIDKSTCNNWKDKWFSLPYVNVIINLFTGKRLQLPNDLKAWAISQRGRYNNYLEDAIQAKHHVSAGVTTLYILRKNGKEIIKYDPWSPKHVQIGIYLPEDPYSTFEAINMSASGSTLMVVGHQIEENEEGTGIKRTLQIQTRLVDIDSEGWNPGLKYDYFDNSKGEDVRVIPLPQWQNHPLELEGEAVITKNITIIQTGEGNNARELFVEGKNKEGLIGYYHKKIDENLWHFEADDHIHSDELDQNKFLTVKEIDLSTTFATTVHNYKGQAHFKALPKTEISCQLNQFGQRSYESTIEFTIENHHFYVRLQKKKTLKNFVGLPGDSYELVIPQTKSVQQSNSIKIIFNNQKVIPVSVQEGDEQIILSLPKGQGQIIFKK